MLCILLEFEAVCRSARMIRPHKMRRLALFALIIATFPHCTKNADIPSTSTSDSHRNTIHFTHSTQRSPSCFLLHRYNVSFSQRLPSPISPSLNLHSSCRSHSPSSASLPAYRASHTLVPVLLVESLRSLPCRRTPCHQPQCLPPLCLGSSSTATTSPSTMRLSVRAISSLSARTMCASASRRFTSSQPGKSVTPLSTPLTPARFSGTPSRTASTTRISPSPTPSLRPPRSCAPF